MDSSPYLCLSDFIAPKDSGVQDYIGLFATTAGLGTEELCRGSVLYIDNVNHDL